MWNLSPLCNVFLKSFRLTFTEMISRLTVRSQKNKTCVFFCHTYLQTDTRSPTVMGKSEVILKTKWLYLRVNFIRKMTIRHIPSALHSWV